MVEKSKKDERPTCFVICPIGEEGSLIRKRSDQVLKHIIQPVVEAQRGYRVIRADKLPDPGRITTQVIQHLIKDELVVADLSGHNPNVFYELAIRHAAVKPYIQLAAPMERIPFDIHDQRTIVFDVQDLDSVEACKSQLSAQVMAIQDPSFRVESPIGDALQLGRLDASPNPAHHVLAAILKRLDYIENNVRRDAGVTWPHDAGPTKPYGASIATDQYSYGHPIRAESHRF
jgi:hypothetical protein